MTTIQQDLKVEKGDLVAIETHTQEIVIAKIVDISADNFSLQKLDNNTLVSVARSNVARIRTANVPAPFKPAPKVDVPAVDQTMQIPSSNG